jgi:MraZ protein
MSKNEHALEGDYEHKLDPKNRVSVPAEWRSLTGDGALRLLQSSKYKVPTIRVLTENEYDEMLQTVDGMENWTPAEKKNMKGKLHSRCQKVALSDQGKLLIPKTWCETSGLEPGGVIKLVGRGTYFEIFSPINYKLMTEREDAETAKLNEEVDFF